MLEDYLKRKINTLLESDKDANEFFSECVKKYNSGKKDIKVSLEERTIGERIVRGEEVKVLIRQHQCPGDILTLSASIRDLKQKFPNVKIKLETSCGEIWDNNPYIDEYPDEEADIDFKAKYPLVDRSNTCGQHMIYGFKEYIENELGIDFNINRFGCDVHLSSEEKRWTNQVEETFGYKGKFWLINTGHKNDYPLKQWPTEKWQEVVDKLKDKITFVQVGVEKHNTIPLNNVYNLIGKTNLRQLIRLAYHSEGGFGHVSMINHLMSCWDKPSFIIAGGRETATWEAYNTTQYFHTIGQLQCCGIGGCWKSKPKDCPKMEENNFPKCMNIIQPREVIDQVLHVIGNKTQLTPAIVKENKDLPKKEYQIYRIAGLKRSGNHCVINWLTGNVEGDICFRNNCHKFKNIDNKKSDSTSNIINNTNSRMVNLNEEKDYFFQSFEDKKLINVFDVNGLGEFFGENISTIHKVLILRDPFNTIASRLQHEKNNMFLKEDLKIINSEQKRKRLIELYKNYLRTALANNDVTTIKYNSWLTDVNYRKHICDIFNTPCNDLGMEDVPSWGGGSSFKNVKTKTTTTDRWLEFKDDDYFKLVFSDKELLELSLNVFPEFRDNKQLLSCIK